MGREDHCLRTGDVIFTVLFIKLAKPVRANWTQRNGGAAADITQSDIDALSRDFLNVEARARDIAAKAVSRAELRVKYVVPVITAVIAAVASLAFAWFQPLGELKLKVAQLESKVGVDGLRQRIELLEERVPRPLQTAPAPAKPRRE